MLTDTDELLETVVKEHEELKEVIVQTFEGYLFYI